MKRMFDIYDIQQNIISFISSFNDFKSYRYLCKFNYYSLFKLYCETKKTYPFVISTNVQSSLISHYYEHIEKISITNSLNKNYNSYSIYTSLRSLTCYMITNEMILNLPQLTSLTIVNNKLYPIHEKINLSLLKRLESLKMFRNVDVGNSLLYLTNLTYFDCRDNHYITDNSIKTLTTALKILIIHHHITYGSYEHLYNLEEINITLTVQQLNNFPKLKVLYSDGTYNIDDMLKYQYTLCELYIRYNSAFVLNKPFYVLNKLIIYSNKILPSVLLRMKLLTYLNISYNSDLSDNDIKKLTNLVTLSCNNTMLTNDGISCLINIKELFCDCTKITDEGLENLKKINMLSCKLTNITINGIKHLPNLKRLYGNKCLIKEVLIYNKKLNISY
jgi:hypothetical protein